MTDATDILNVLGRYARAHDYRDSEAMAALFADHATIEIFNARGSTMTPIGKLEGLPAIRDAVRQMMAPHGERAWSQNVISAPIIDVGGDEAVIDAQFMVFSIVAATEPENGWPAATFGAQGAIVPIEAGQYRAHLRRTARGWTIAAMRIEHRLPMVFGQG
ncbi:MULTISPECIES: nuclear transport factor 2 family protein [Novosphingobium]|uniref:nuclear transport factor 2 family protein n=1 Tax=Novosphingobium TaxID=165696 RepID=UPI001CD715CE|nr:nuclear transport factor 2 family protein [Novosphingobium percolationis]MCH7629899.1 nuclear transport factor 2 family protein [Pseudomonadota bacterium]